MVNLSHLISNWTGPQVALATSTGIGLGIIGMMRLAPHALDRISGLLPSRGFHSKDSSIQIGSIKISDEDRLRHSHILGATGSGKSVLIEQLLFQDILRGYGAIIIDAKGERSFFEQIRKFCNSCGRGGDLHYLSATYEDESVRWNPCRLGSLSELQSKFYAAGRYDHPHYAKAAELIYSQAFRSLMKSKPEGFDLTDLITELKRLTNDGKDENTKGVYFDLMNLVDLEWAGILGTKPKSGNQHEIDLMSLTKNNQILFVDLPTEGKSVQSARLGALMLQEITLLSGMRKRSPQIRSNKPFSVIVDEFDAFATEPFVTFLNKGRSSGFMIHLAHQTLSDLKKVSPTFEGQILGNVNVRFVFRTDLADDAENLSRSFGTKSVKKMTYQTDGIELSGRGSMREVQEFQIHPDALKSLGVGECVISVKSRRILKQLKIPMRDFTQGVSQIAPCIRSPMKGGTVESKSVKKDEGHVPQAFARHLKTEKGAPAP